MIYEPTINSEWEWWRVDKLLSSDPIMYAWLVERARVYLNFKVEINRIDTSPLSDTVLWRATWGLSGNRRNNSPFVVLPD